MKSRCTLSLRILALSLLLVLPAIPAAADITQCPLFGDIAPNITCSNNAVAPAPATAVASASESEVHRAAADALEHYAYQKLDLAGLRQSVDTSGTFRLEIDGSVRTLVLEPVYPLARDYRELVVGAGGERKTTPRPAATFRGHVRGAPDSSVRLSLDDELFFGFVKVDGIRWFIDPASRFVAGGGSDRVVIYREDALRQEAGVSCGLTDLEEGLQSVESGARGETAAGSAAELREIELAIDADAEYSGTFGSFTGSHIAGVMNMVNGFYEDDLDLTFKIVQIRLFQNASTDPYDGCEINLLWCEIWDEWQNTPALQAVERDFVLLLSGKAAFDDRTDIGDGIVRTRGYSGLFRTVCREPSNSYAWSTNYREAGLISHEIGHAFNADHVGGTQCPDVDCGQDTCTDPNTTGGPVMCGSIQSPVTGFSTGGINQITGHVSAFGFICLAGPEITLEDPTGGELFRIGQTGVIEWSSTAIPGNVKIELSRDGGVTWEVIRSSIGNNGINFWAATGPTTSQARIRVSSLDDPQVNDASAANFSILPRPAMTVIAPNGGETWTVGSSRTLRWSTQATGNVRIELSRNGGATWNTLFFSTPNDGSQVWNVTGPLTSTARLRVSSLSDLLVTDTSNADFSIGDFPTVISPNGGEAVGLGVPEDITWASSASGNVKIELSRNGGSIWETLFASTPDDGTESWTPIGALTDTARIRVTRLDGPGLSDLSDGNFAIVGSIAVFDPAATDSWSIGEVQLIQWSSQGVTGDVQIELFRGEFSPEVIVASTEDDGRFSYTVTGPGEDKVIVRVQSVSDARVSGSSETFEINAFREEK